MILGRLKWFVSTQKKKHEKSMMGNGGRCRSNKGGSCTSEQLLVFGVVVGSGRHTDRHCMRWKCEMGRGCSRKASGRGSGGREGRAAGLISVRWWTAIWTGAGSCPAGTPSAGLLSWRSCGLRRLQDSDTRCSTLRTQRDQRFKGLTFTLVQNRRLLSGDLWHILFI